MQKTSIMKRGDEMKFSRYINGIEIEKKELKNVVYTSKEIVNAVNEARKRVSEAKFMSGSNGDQRISG